MLHIASCWSAYRIPSCLFLRIACTFRMWGACDAPFLLWGACDAPFSCGAHAMRPFFFGAHAMRFFHVGRMRCTLSSLGRMRCVFFMWGACDAPLEVIQFLIRKSHSFCKVHQVAQHVLLFAILRFSL
jgi:hypothetical protein